MLCERRPRREDLALCPCPGSSDCDRSSDPLTPDLHPDMNQGNNLFPGRAGRHGEGCIFTTDAHGRLPMAIPADENGLGCQCSGVRAKP